jgi:hypothetical protein
MGRSIIVDASFHAIAAASAIFPQITSWARITLTLADRNRRHLRVRPCSPSLVPPLSVSSWLVSTCPSAFVRLSARDGRTNIRGGATDGDHCRAEETLRCPRCSAKRPDGEQRKRRYERREGDTDRRNGLRRRAPTTRSAKSTPLTTLVLQEILRYRMAQVLRCGIRMALRRVFRRPRG